MSKKKVFRFILVSLDPKFGQRAKELAQILSISGTGNTTLLTLVRGVDLDSAIESFTSAEHRAGKPADIVVLLGRTSKIDPRAFGLLLSVISPEAFIIAAADPVVATLAKQVVAQTGQKPATARK